MYSGSVARIHVEPELDARAGCGRLDAQPDGARNGCDSECSSSSASPVPAALDADRGRLAEVDLDAEVARQRRLDHLLLDLAVERDRDLLAGVVLADVDQRVLLRELVERGGEARAFARARGRRPSPASAERSGARAAPAARRSSRRSGCRRGPSTWRSGPPTRRGWTAAPRSNTLSAVTLLLAAVGRERARVPEKSRTYAMFSPGGPRSILKTRARERAVGRPSRAAGSSSAIPFISASTPAPVIAEPKKTGCTSPRATARGELLPSARTSRERRRQQCRPRPAAPSARPPGVSRSAIASSTRRLRRRAGRSCSRRAASECPAAAARASAAASAPERLRPRR